VIMGFFWDGGKDSQKKGVCKKKASGSADASKLSAVEVPKELRIYAILLIRRGETSREDLAAGGKGRRT